MGSNDQSAQAISASYARFLDQRATELGFTERLLIENASSNLFSVIDQVALGKKVAVFAGRGNNGADVLSCARKLISRGYSVTVIVVSEKPLNDEASFQAEVLKQSGALLSFVKALPLEEVESLIEGVDFILEGILGIGVKGNVSPFLQGVMTTINSSGKPVVSCDIPSGLCPDEGVVLGAAVKAAYTVTFIGPKSGFFINQGPKCCGEIFVVDIGISRKILEKMV